MYNLARNLKFRKIHNKLQNQISKIIKEVRTSKHIIVPADKSHNWYKIPIPVHNKMITNTVSKDNKYSSAYEVKKVNSDSLDLVQSNKPGLESRVEIMSRATVSENPKRR